MDPVSFSGDRLRLFGLGSGLDIDQVVEQLMQVERAPLDRLVQRRQVLVWTKEDYLSIHTALDALRQALMPLRLTSTFGARTVVSSDEGVARATAAPGVAEGTYTLKVNRLASGVQVGSSAPITPAGTTDSSSLWTQFGIDPAANPTIDLQITVTDSQGREHTATLSFSHASGDGIDDVVAAINQAGLGITASYDPALDRIFLSSRETGANVSLSVQDVQVQTGDGPKWLWADLFKLPTAASGQDAEFELNGVTGLTQSTNRFTVAGITYELTGTGTTSITVAQDTDGIVQAIKAFVDKYNEVLGKINAELAERRLYDYPPLTEAQKKEMTEEEIKLWEERARQGMLQGDPLLSSIASQMRRDVSSRVGTGPYTSLSAIGITTGLYSEGGKLYVDEAKLRQALTTDPEAVASLFTAGGEGDETRGVAIRLADTLNASIDRIRSRAGVSGLLADNSGIGRQIALLEEQMERLEQRLAIREEQYYRQFTLLEQLMVQMNAQAAWLMQQFGGAA